jgi:hypothetical protein
MLFMNGPAHHASNTNKCSQAIASVVRTAEADLLLSLHIAQYMDGAYLASGTR